jgi:formylglycine-generating enzyme required for sulfatase activity
MSAALGLDPLLAALREAGLTVGVAEMARLRQVFALGPRLGENEDRRLKAVLRAVLVKSDEDRNRFEPVFESWLGRAGLEVSLREVAPPPEPVLPAGRPKRKWPVWRVLTMAILIVFSLIGRPFKTKESGPAPTPTPAQIPLPTPVPGQDFTPQPPAPTPQPPTPTPPVWRGWMPLTLGCLALLTAGGLWVKLSRRSWLPEKDSEPAKKGPPRAFLSLPEGAGPQLLQPDEQDALVWGIGHFVAEERTRRLDLPATVRETARAGGIPHLRFHQARHPREVWLWIDEAAEDPAIPRIAAEIEAALQTYGLPVELALFRGVPDWLVSAAGQAFAPSEVDERRDAALVAILTDGRILARHHAADDRRVRLDAVLRGLSHWPRLAFVDFAAEPGDLSAVLAKHSLARITPPEVAAFLGSNDTAKRKAPSLATGDTAWAAACAVSPSSVDEPRAFQLRKRLGLATSPWALRDLRAQAPGPLGRLQWQPEERARLVNWLRAAEAHSENEVASGSLLARALDFWEKVYTDVAPLDTPAYQHLTMERALLGLWRDPSNAVQKLYSLHRGALREVIERKLYEMSPADYGEPRHLHLPWAWAKRSGAEQIMLQEMKLGGRMPRATLRRPGRLWLGLALCLGLAAGALGKAVLSGWRQPPAQLQSCRTGELLEEGGMTFVHVCPGIFTMGSSKDDSQAYDDEKPAHPVTLSEYWIGRTEVTNDQYRADGPGTLPVNNVTWDEAKTFCESHGWRLPTEAEWEHAARADTQTPWSSGADENRLGDFAWFGEDFSGQPHPVATKKPNPWGIHDMHGNVWEWVEDWSAPYEPGPRKDPKGPESGEYRAVRGGAFNNPSRDLRSANRNWYLPSIRYGDIGFRCARSPGRQP